MNNDRIALLDLDGSLADYDAAMTAQLELLKAPDEEPFRTRAGEPTHITARRKLVQRIPGFWRDLAPISVGFQVVDAMRDVGFDLHVLTKGPTGAPNAWGEKLEWSQRYIPDAAVNVFCDKSIVYGRVLFDDHPLFFEAWLACRPRGQVVCLAQAWNADYAAGGTKEHPRVLRYDGTQRAALRFRLEAAFAREVGQ